MKAHTLIEILITLVPITVIVAYINAGWFNNNKIYNIVTYCYIIEFWSIFLVALFYDKFKK